MMVVQHHGSGGGRGDGDRVGCPPQQLPEKRPRGGRPRLAVREHARPAAAGRYQHRRQRVGQQHGERRPGPGDEGDHGEHGDGSRAEPGAPRGQGKAAPAQAHARRHLGQHQARDGGDEESDQRGDHRVGDERGGRVAEAAVGRRRDRNKDRQAQAGAQREIPTDPPDPGLRQDVHDRAAGPAGQCRPLGLQLGLPPGGALDCGRVAGRQAAAQRVVGEHVAGAVTAEQAPVGGILQPAH